MDAQTQYIDDLSGAYNRRYLNEKLDKDLKNLIAEQKPFAIVMIDIDHFKDINDTYGHLIGDEIIRRFAKYLKDSLRDSDTILRYGGDEFLCIMPISIKRDAERVLWRLVQQCDQQKFAEHKITISAGLAAYPDDGKSVARLIEIADGSLYDAKRSGRDRVGVVSEKRIQLPIKTFIDRISEKERLRKTILHDEGGIKLAVVKGTVGIGKSRLVRETLGLLKGIEVLWSNCMYFIENVAYYPVREIIQYRMQRRGRDAIKQIPAAYRIELGKLVPDVIADEDEAAGIEAVVDKYRLYEGVRKLIELGSEKIVLVIDDIQWIDNESVEVLKYILRVLRDNPITVLLIYRIEELPQSAKNFLTHISRELPMQEIELEPLQLSDIVASIKAILNDKPDALLIDYIERESGGNPFYIEELMRSLLDQRYLIFREGRWFFKEPQIELVPKSIEDIAIRKYNSVSEEARAVLDSASVIGWFDPVLIQELTGFNEGHIIGLFDSIHKTGITSYKRDRFEFREDVIRDVLYKKVQPMKVVQLHRQIFRFLEKEYSGKEDAVIESLAHHAYKGMVRDGGVNLNMQAAQYTQERYANSSAIQYYTWALELLKNKTGEEAYKQHIECLENRAEINMSIGRSDRALKDLEIALRKAEEANDKIEQGRILTKRSHVLAYNGKFQEAIVEGKKSMDIAQEINDPAVADAYNILGACYLEIADYDTARDYFEKAYALYTKQENKKNKIKLLTNFGILGTMTHDLESALKYHKEVMKLGIEIGDRKAEAIACNNIGNVHLISGDLRTALEYFSRAQTMEHDVGYRLLESISLYNIGTTAKSLGQYDRALESLEHAVQIMRDTGHRMNEAECYALIANVYDFLGDDKKALQFFEKSFRIEEHKADIFYYMENLLRAAHFHLDRDNMPQAKYYLDMAQAVADEKGHDSFNAYLLPVFCEYDLKRGEYKTFRENIGKLKKMAEKLKAQSALDACDILQALYYLETGEYEKAEELLQYAFDTMKKQGRQLECGKILLHLGRLAQEQSDMEKAREYFTKAAEVFETLGARGWLLKTRSKIEDLTRSP
ncbi:MAG: diguanylate cyclase [candidate division WOR-3 bacterium]|nr:MAG: diguanylate cyclase [candidate division WOR-3 bacterium]